MNSILRIALGVNKVSPANPMECLEEIKELLARLDGNPVDIIVFPSLALCSPNCGSLLHNGFLQDECAQALELLRVHTRDLASYLLVGLAYPGTGDDGAVAVLYRGELVGMIPADWRRAELPSNMLEPSTIFACGSLRFSVYGGDPLMMPQAAAQAAKTGCDLLIVPAYRPYAAGTIDMVKAAAMVVSRSAGCAVAVVGGGIGDGSSPHLYQGYALLYEDGVALMEERAGQAGFLLHADLDVDVIRAGGRGDFTPAFYSVTAQGVKSRILRPLPATPFLPAGRRAEYLNELFDLQVRSLMSHIENSGCRRLVIGLDGEIGSAVAALVCFKAAEALGLGGGSLIGVTMPGSATDDQDYFNALSLIDILNCEGKDIPVREDYVRQLEMLGGSPVDKDRMACIEARQRTRILLDLAEREQALSVGSMDMTCLALGLTAFGDCAHHEVNASVPRSVLRALAGQIAHSDLVEGVCELLEDILERTGLPGTPPDLSGGSDYPEEELYDFFLYYLFRHGFRISKLYHYSSVAFAGVYPPGQIKEKLRWFVVRLCAGRSHWKSFGNSGSVTGYHLGEGGFDLPIDLNPQSLLEELDAIQIESHPGRRLP